MRIGRRWFMGLLPGAAAAQTNLSVSSEKGVTATFTLTRDTPGRVHSAERGSLIYLDKGQPVNGECPACGAMAPKWKPYPIGIDAATMKELLKTHDRVECAHCHCVFGMDAEADDAR